MAFTVTVVDKNVVGKNREHILDVTADAASGVVDTGLGLVLGFSLVPISMATWTNGVPRFKANLNAASAVSNGNVMASALTSGDRFFLIVKGR